MRKSISDDTAEAVKPLAGDPAALLSAEAAAAWLSMSRATFWRRVKDGTFPAPLKIGGITRWRREELLEAISSATNSPNL